jgi:hypothetical protein
MFQIPAFPADHLDGGLAGILATEADAAVRRPARLVIFTCGDDGAMGVTVMTPGPMNAKPPVIGRVPVCMTVPV